jgi:CheY-like chemotaxis protein
VAEAHGGTVDLLPSPSGARFRVTLPASAAEARPAAAPEPAPVPASGRALVVDDDAELAETLAETLTRAGYGATVACGGAEAIERLRLRTFDLVLIDLSMAEPDGLGVYAWMAAHRPAMAARAAFITGASLASGEVERARRTGRPVIEKPFQPDDLRLLRAMTR